MFQKCIDEAKTMKEEEEYEWDEKCRPVRSLACDDLESRLRDLE